MNEQEYKEMTIDELEERLKEKRTELVEQRFEVGSRQLKNYNKIGQTRREIARILTVMRQKKDDTGAESDKEAKKEEVSNDDKSKNSKQ